MFFIYIYLNLLLALEMGSYFIFSSVLAVKAAAQTLAWVFFIFFKLDFQQESLTFVSYT